VTTLAQETAVVCDTTAYLPADVVAERGIELISLYVAVDGEQRPELEITDYGRFYEDLRGSQSGATTSQPSIGDFLTVYEPLLESGREVVSVHISSGISGTFEAAGQARDRLIEEGKDGERIHLFDSRSACGGTGLSALAAATAAAGGAGGEAALARARQARELAELVGAAALSATDQHYLAFSAAFEQRLVDQGRDEQRTLDQTLDRAWTVLSELPRRELTMVSASQLDARYVPAGSPSGAPA
jgi:hypothetical protein